jgi:long-chain fatty acid transport protein
MFWNPAALSSLHGTHFSFGALVMLPDQRFNGIVPDQTEYRVTPQVVFPPNIYLTHTFRGGLGLGVSVNVPYAEKVDWGSDWPGGALVTRSDIRVVSVNAAVSMKIGKSTAVGGAVLVNIPRLSFARRIQGATDTTASILSLDGVGAPAIRFHMGLTKELAEGVTFSAAYRTAVSEPITSGQVSSQDASATVPGNQIGTFRAEMGLPGEIETGLSWRPGNWIELSVRGSYAFWSNLKQSTISYEGGLTGTEVVPLNWKNTASAGAGIEVDIAGMALRGGLRWQQSPIPDETLSPFLPDADATGFSAGIGYHVEDGLVLDFSYSFLAYRQRNITTSGLTSASGTPFVGTYSAKTTAIGLTISYSWE